MVLKHLQKNSWGKSFRIWYELGKFWRVVAPGALLSKGIMSARILARGGKPPPSGLAMATVGGGSSWTMYHKPRLSS
jgi:hypothetical protein